MAFTFIPDRVFELVESWKETTRKDLTVKFVPYKNTQLRPQY